MVPQILHNTSVQLKVFVNKMNIIYENRAIYRKWPYQHAALLIAFLVIDRQDSYFHSFKLRVQLLQ